MQLLLILFFLSSSTTITITATAAAAAPKNVFILSGQSNMFGRGGVTTTKLADGTILRTWDGVVPAECRPNPLILRLSEEMECEEARWDEAREPLHKLVVNSSDNSEGIGPGMPFASALLKRDPAIGSIGLVPCAVSGSNISSWGRGSPNYTRMLGRARAAVTHEGSVLRALLWYQGESDSQYESDAEAYRCRLVKLFNDIRGDLQLPLLQIIQVSKIII